MLIFDAADRGECTVRRRPTSTPLQALVLLNDPQYVEAARVLAEKLLTEHEDTDKLLSQAFRTLTSRMPDETERSLLNELLSREMERFSRSPEDARAYLEMGEAKWDRQLDPIELASWAVLVHAVMNTDEAFTRR